VLTGDAAAGLDVLERRAEGREQLKRLTDLELLRRATRELCITIILGSQELQRHLPEFVAEQPMETGVLLRALVQAIAAPKRSCAVLISEAVTPCHAAAMAVKRASRALRTDT
jgi:hypothetical protein